MTERNPSHVSLNDAIRKDDVACYTPMERINSITRDIKVLICCMMMEHCLQCNDTMIDYVIVTNICVLCIKQTCEFALQLATRNTLLDFPLRYTSSSVYSLLALVHANHFAVPVKLVFACPTHATTMSDASSASPPSIISQQTSPITLETIRQLIDTRADLNAFYSGLHARLSATRGVMISLTPQPLIHLRLNDLKKIDPGRKQLPLHAVPFIAKDNIDAPPHRTTAACRSFGYQPATPAHIIRELESLGAILMGKANMDQFACGLVGTRSPYGIPLNPHNNAYIPGGSSSGSAVAVALGLCVFSLGTDTAGSGRVPAAMNGIVGLKPTKGLLSTSGVVPAAESQDCVSIFANTVDDAAEILAHLSAKPDVMCAFCRVPPDEKLVPVDYGLSPAATVQSFRFGVPKKDQLEFYEDSVAEESYNMSVSMLEKIGGQRMEIEFEPFREVGEMLYGSALVAERYTSVGQFVREQAVVNEGVLDRNVAKIIMSGDERKRAHEVFAAQKRVTELGMAARRTTWMSVDVVVVPSVPCAMTIEQVQGDPIRQNSVLGIYTNFVNLMDLCAIAVPGVEVHDESRVPRGITIIAQAFEERKVVLIARKFECQVAEEFSVGM